jgi:hypothetical protein
MVLGETGVIPISCEIKKRVVNYRFKISSYEKQQNISKCVYDSMYNMKLNNCYIDPWLNYVEESLGKAGMLFVFINGSSNFDFKWFKSAFSLRIDDCFKQGWHDLINQSNSCIVYRLFKDTHNFEKYIISMPLHLSSQVLKFRTRNLFLPVMNFNIPNNDTSCLYCQDKCGDEFHYIMSCNHFKSQRDIFIPNTMRVPNVLNFKRILQSERHSVNIAKFINLKLEMLELKLFKNNQ